MQTEALVVLLLLASTTAKEMKCTIEDDRKQPQKHVNCAEKTDPAERGICYSQWYKEKKIGDAEYQVALQNVIKELKSVETYYSGGVVYGQENKLVFSSQKHFMFDWSIELPLKVPYWNTPTIVSMINTQDEGVKYVMVEDGKHQPIHKDFSMVKPGNVLLRNIYFEQDWNIKTRTEDCEAFKNSEAYRKTQGIKNIIVVVSRHHHCPEYVVNVTLGEIEDHSTGVKTLSVSGEFF